MWTASLRMLRAHIDLNNQDCLCMCDCFDGLNNRSAHPRSAGFLTLLRARSLQSATHGGKKDVLAHSLCAECVSAIYLCYNYKRGVFNLRSCTPNGDGRNRARTRAKTATGSVYSIFPWGITRRTRGYAQVSAIYLCYVVRTWRIYLQPDCIHADNRNSFPSDFGARR